MKRLLFIQLFLFAIIFGLKAQNYRIEYTYLEESKKSSTLKEIIFRDTITNFTAKKIDVLAMNPFGNLPYPIHSKATMEAGTKIYDLRGKTLKETVPARILNLYHYDNPEAIYPTMGQYSIEHRKFQNMVMLKYSFSVGNDTALLVTYSDFYVYGVDGTELFSLKDNDFNIINADIDPSGRYLFYTYGVRSGITIVLDGGIKIYELKEKHPVMEFPGEEITVRFMNENMLYVFYNGMVRNNKPDRCLRVLDFSKMGMFSRTFNYEDMLQIKAVNPTSISFKNDSVEPFFLKFDYEPLEWKSYFKTGKYIEYQYYTNVSESHQIKTIEFKDADKNIVLRKINVNEINPFKDMPYAVIDSIGYTVKYYNLPSVNSQDFLPKVVSKMYEPILGKKAALQFAQTRIDCMGDDKNAILIFTLATGMKYVNFAIYSKMFVFNTEGKEIFRREDNEGYIGQCAIDKSNSYLCYRYAIGTSDTILKTGYRIWDLKRKGYMTEVSIDNATYNFVAPGILCLYSNATMPNGKPGTLLTIYDLKNNWTYTKAYDYESTNEIQSYTNEGLVFKNNKTEYFKKDFVGEELSWKKMEGNGK